MVCETFSAIVFSEMFSLYSLVWLGNKGQGEIQIHRTWLLVLQVYRERWGMHIDERIEGWGMLLQRKALYLMYVIN